MAKKEAPTRKGRPSKYDGKFLYKIATTNPRRQGSHGYKSFDAIKNGMKYEAYVAAGGRRNDLDYCVEKGYVEVLDAKRPAKPRKPKAK